MADAGRTITIRGESGGPSGPKIDLERWKNIKIKAVSDMAYENSKNKKKQHIIDEKENLIKVADLEIHNATIELALMGTTGELHEELKHQLKEGKKELEAFKKGGVDVVDYAGGSKEGLRE